MSSSKSRKGEAFYALVKQAGPLPTSMLATPHDTLPSPSVNARRVAAVMIGGLSDEPERVQRLANRLDRLVALDHAAKKASSKRKNG